MTSERWKQITEILEALDTTRTVTTKERRTTLDRLCGGDRELRREVETLQAQEDEDFQDFLTKPVLPIHQQSPAPESPSEPVLSSSRQSPAPGTRIGHYKLLHVLGRGGFGDVYQAVREDDYEQKVAVKLLQRHKGTTEIVRRFHIERRILASLEHPNISRIIDGGTTDDGIPYQVMEYVEGKPINRYCDERKLSTRERLALFCQVCTTVQFAHQNLVVHRDLKPGNILVTSDGELKLLDFGIAKLLDPKSADHGLTRDNQAPMTFKYASPEQVNQEPITTACDIYALGLLLYELLTGRLPCHLDVHPPMPYMQMLNAICEDEPQKPSTAVRHTENIRGVGGDVVRLTPESVSELRDGDPRKLRRRLAGDVDEIVLKALRKKPRQRYGSAFELSEDIHRHLEGRPVMARAGTLRYRTGKFVRRHRWGLAMAASFLLLILGFAMTTTVLWRRAVDVGAQAERERMRAQAVSRFLEDLFESANPDETRGEDVTVLEILDRGKEKLAENLENELDINADLLRSLGSVYNNLGDYQQARELKEEALRIRRALSPEDHPKLVTEISNMARLHYDLGDYEEAERLYREALAMRRRLGQGDSDLNKTILNLAGTLVQRGAYAEAEELQLEALAMRKELFGPEDPKVALSRFCLGALHLTRGDFEKAESYLRHALQIYLKAHGPEHTRVAEVLNSLGRLLHAQGHHDEAEHAYERALDIRRQRLGESHKSVADTKKNFAALLLTRGEPATAGVLLDQALTVLRRSMPESDWTLADAEGVLGMYLLDLGCFEEAESILIKSYRIISEVKGDQAIHTRNAASRLVELYEAWGREEEAEKYRATGR